MAESRIGIELVEQSAGDRVSCLDGTVRVGQMFERPEGPGGEVRPVSPRMFGLLRYDQEVEFSDPPHTGRAQPTGTGVGELVQGTFPVG
ncbi:hypothetical protein [Lentzea sp. HUAS12]|uniref:hypothetical protein n=1 Tax=Lentzea sp. HUAS12 TaxID=2951806 RepID=UPI0020A0AEA2|nr:hypothetical protein [Lentzea sp. HUAS12]USX53923.1 hypothetical protein ND450_07430 [Lentzea sp. HUAS12]